MKGGRERGGARGTMGGLAVSMGHGESKDKGAHPHLELSMWEMKWTGRKLAQTKMWMENGNPKTKNNQ
eukprot:scaffold223804_cov31-Tisochrysis_lutea.AAC.2